MKIALVHDYIKEYGGAERVLEAFHEVWPQAPIFTTVFLPQYLGPHQDRFKNWKINTSLAQKIPFVGKLISPLRIFSPWYFENIDFSEFDMVLVSATGAYFPNLIVRHYNTCLITYCHTPPRYLYGYPTARDWKKNPFFKFIAEFANHSLRQKDYLSYQRTDFIVTNSIEVKRRVEKFYRREASVIYPPVNINHKSKLRNSKQNGDYYLAGGRLARAKHIDLAIQACKKLGVKLKVFGRGFADYEEELYRLKNKNIEFVGEVSDSQLAELFSNAKAFIFPSEYEDFGIVAVEAAGYGCPVVGYNQAGIKESVIDGKTGVLFDDLTVEGVITGIKTLKKGKISAQDCYHHARKFSKDRFKKEIKRYVDDKFKEYSKQ